MKPGGAPSPLSQQQVLGVKGNGTNAAPNKRFACFVCGSPDHRRASCPMGDLSINSTRPNYSVCTACGAYHATNGPCFGRGHPGVFATEQCTDRTADNNDVASCPFVLPVCINGFNVMAMRNSGNTTYTIIKPRLVNKMDYTGDYVTCRGLFDDVCYRIPLATVRVFAPSIGCDVETTVRVGVWEFGTNFDCVLGNQTFDMHPQFQDVIKYHPDARKGQFPTHNVKRGRGTAGNRRSNYDSRDRTETASDVLMDRVMTVGTRGR